MASDLFFRLIFSALWLILMAHIAWAGYLTRASGTRGRRGVGWIRVLAVALALPYFVGVVLYALSPSSILFLWIPLPDWLRFISLLVAVMGTLMSAWGLRVLGKNWAPSLSDVRNESALITTGPYGIVRNPIYLGVLVLIPCLALVASNWLLLVTGIILCLLLYSQVRGEEATLIEHFGDAYREYMKQTPRLIPKLKDSRAPPSTD